MKSTSNQELKLSTSVAQRADATAEQLQSLVAPRHVLREAVRTKLRKLPPRQARMCLQRGYLGRQGWSELRLPARLFTVGFPEGVFVKEWLSRHEEALKAQCANTGDSWWLERQLEELAPRTAPRTYDQADQDESDALLAWTASVGQITPQVLQRLGRYSPRERVLSEIGCPHYLLDHFARHREAQLRRIVASNPATPDRLLATLAADVNPNVRAAISRRPQCPVEIWKALANDSARWVRWSLAINPACPGDLLDHLANDVSTEVRAAVAENPVCPGGLLERLAGDVKATVRARVARHQACPVQVMARLIEDEHAEVWWALASNKACPPDLLRQLKARVPFGQLLSRGYESFAQNLACPVDVLEEAADAHSYARSKVALNPSCPSDLLEKLASGSDAYGSSAAVARHPNASDHLRRQIFGDLIVRTPAFNIPNLTADPRFPEDLRQEVPARLWWQSMQTLARKRRTQHVLDRLMKESSGRTLAELFSQEADRWLLQPDATWAAQLIGAYRDDLLSIDSAAADSAAASSTDVVRLLGLSQPCVAPERLARHVCSTDWLERLAIACNPGCPSGMLAQLTADADTVVAAAARMTEAERQQGRGWLDTRLAEIQRAPIDLARLAHALAARLPRARQAADLLGTRWAPYLSIEQRLGSVQAGSDPRLLSLLPESTAERVWRYLIDTRYPKLGWRSIAHAKRADIRAEAAALPGCPADLLRRFADDNSYLVRLAVAGNPDCTPELLTHLAEDSHGAVADAVEELRNETAILLARLSNELDREGIAWARAHPLVARIAMKCPAPSPALDIDTGTVLSQLYVLGHPAFPADKRKSSIAILARRVDEWIDKPEPKQGGSWQLDDFKVPLAVLGLLPQEGDTRKIAKAARSRDWLQRAAAAMAPDAQPHVLKMLLDDPVEIVRQLAAQGLRRIASPEAHLSR